MVALALGSKFDSFREVNLLDRPSCSFLTKRARQTFSAANTSWSGRPWKNSFERLFFVSADRKSSASSDFSIPDCLNRSDNTDWAWNSRNGCVWLPSYSFRRLFCLANSRTNSLGFSADVKRITWWRARVNPTYSNRRSSSSPSAMRSKIGVSKPMSNADALSNLFFDLLLSRC